MTDEAQESPRVEHWRTDPDPERCHARFSDKRCIGPIDHEKHVLEGGWSWFANRPNEANERLAELESALSTAQERIIALEAKCDLYAASLKQADERVRVLEEALRDTQAWLILDGYDPGGWDGGPDCDPREEPFNRIVAALSDAKRGTE